MNAVTYTSGQAVIQPKSDTAEMFAALSFVGWRSEGADLVSEAHKGPSRWSMTAEKRGQRLADEVPVTLLPAGSASWLLSFAITGWSLRG